MTLSRRKFIALVGGGVVVAASAGLGYTVTRRPMSASKPWDEAGQYSDPRKRALSYALLAPNPHNRQPWIIDLVGEEEVFLYADTERLLPHTDPFSRQITIGLGCFLELMRMAAAQDGYRIDMRLFPQGEDAAKLDARPIMHATFVKDASERSDPLFVHAMARRSLKEPFDVTQPLDEKVLSDLRLSVTAGTTFGGSVKTDDIAYFRNLSHEALRIEIETPHTFKESVDLFRIGHREVDANPDGIDFTGPMFEGLRLAGLFNRETALDTNSAAYQAGLESVYANTDTAMGHIWLISASNTRKDQLSAGMDWMRVNLAGTALGLGMQPLSQALQEYAEMEKLYRDIHTRLAPNGGTVQMFARIGYGPDVGPSPRWPLEAKVAQT